VTELPNGWTSATLGEVVDDARPGFPSGRHNSAGVGVPHLRPMNVSRDGRIDLETVKYVEDQAGVRIQSGDVLFNNTNSPDLVGKTAFFDRAGDWAYSNHMTRLRPSKAIDGRFLAIQLHWLWMTGFYKTILNNHVNQASVATKSLLANVRVLLPPLVEQIRIRAAIEEHLSRLEAGASQLQSTTQRLHTLRSRIVDSAIAGDWEERSFGDMILTLRNGVFVSRPAAEPPGVPIFRISAVRPMALAVDDIRYAPTSDAYPDEAYVDEGDLLFTRYSGNPAFVGACAVVPLLARKTLHPDKLIRVALDRDQCLPQYIEIAFAAGPVRRSVEDRLKTTAGQVGIAGSQLRTVPVPLPSLDVQTQIVSMVRDQLSRADALSSALHHARMRAEALRRSILARAFRGELVPPDPDDEPASVMLERVARERVGPPKSAPRRMPRSVGAR
jgi:type I restriction enzyme S subunit